jgi:hypothetical protein
VAVVTASQYRALVVSVIFSLTCAGGCLLLISLPRARVHGQLPYRRWSRWVPRRHAAVLAVMREYHLAHPDGPGLSGWEIGRRSGRRCARAVLRRMTEAGWAGYSCRPGITAYHIASSRYRLTPAGWAGSARVAGPHLPGEIEELQGQLDEARWAPRGRHSGPVLPDGHPSSPNVVAGPISEVCMPENPSWSG